MYKQWDTMIKKQIKGYKRSNGSYTLRINIKQQDNLKIDDTVYVLSEEEYNNLTIDTDTGSNDTDNRLEELQSQYNKLEKENKKHIKELDDLNNKLEDENKEYKKELNKLKDQNEKLIDNNNQYNQQIIKLTNEIKNEIKQKYRAILKIKDFYENRNLINRIRNKKTDIDNFLPSDAIPNLKIIENKKEE